MAESNCAGPAPKRARCGDSSSAEIANALSACVQQATKDATDFWLRVFLDFCKEKDVSIDLKTASSREINAILCSYYTALRKNKGEYYKRNSYLADRAAMGRYIYVKLWTDQNATSCGCPSLNNCAEFSMEFSNNRGWQAENKLFNISSRSWREISTVWKCFSPMCSIRLIQLNLHNSASFI